MGCDRKGWKGTVAGGQDARGGAEGVAGKLHTGSSAALFDESGSLNHRKAVFTGEPLALQSAERDERVVVMVIVDEILEKLQCTNIAQYGGKSLSTGAVDRQWLRERAQKSNCTAGGVKLPRENKP
jgi:hypothetical protein